MLRSLLTYAREDQSILALAEAARREPQRAFVSASLRPYLLASLIDSDPERPALVVAGDDRAARDLAADLKAFLAPRPVSFYPTSPTWPRRRTWWACASPRSTPCWATAPRCS